MAGITFDRVCGASLAVAIAGLALGGPVGARAAGGAGTGAEEKAPAPAPVNAKAATAHRARVVDVAVGRVVLDAGRDAGFVPGARVAIHASRLVPRPDLEHGGVHRVPSGEVTAVLRIEAADAHRSMAVLGRGDVAVVGDTAELTGAPLSEHLLFPARSPFTWRTGFEVRPFIGVDTGSGTPATKSAGFMVTAYGVWYAPALPLSVRLDLGPAGFGFGGIDRHRPGEASVTVAFESDFVAVGVGGGMMWGIAGPCFTPPAGGKASCEVNTGPTVNQTLRLGAVDGLSFTWRSSVLSQADRFVFGLGSGTFAAPLTRTLTLWTRVGAGEAGWFAADLGMRSYLFGVGAKGTIVITAGLGYASLFDGPSGEVVGGPALTFGMEWRL